MTRQPDGRCSSCPLSRVCTDDYCERDHRQMTTGGAMTAGPRANPTMRSHP